MREQIMKKCMELFAQKGFSETSIQEITDALGLTKAAFYYYFKSKEQVLMEIHTDFIDAGLKEQERILKEYKSAEKMLKENISIIIKSANDPWAGKIFVREMQNLKEEHLAEVKKKRNLYQKNIRRILEIGVENGEFSPDFDLDIVAIGIYALANSTFNWLKPGGRLSESEISDIFCKLVLNGIRKQ